MNHRTKIAAAVTAVAALVLSGCASSPGTSGGKTELTYLSWETEDVMKPVLADFQKQHPDITVKASYAPPVNDYIQALQTRILSGKAPDVFIVAAENKTNLIDNKAVKDLSKEKFAAVMPDFNKKAYGRGDATYGLSVASWGAGVYFNKKLLAKVGYDTVPQDWAGFLTLCEKLKAAGVTPFLEAVDGIPYFVQAFLGSHDAATGGGMDKRIFDGSSSFAKEWTTALTAYSQLYSQKLVSPDTVGLKGDQVITEFVNQKVAMIPQGPWFIDQMRGNKDLEFAISPVPALPGTEPSVAGAAGVGYAISSKTKHLAQAEIFLDYLASARGIEVYQKSSNAITVTDNFTPKFDPALDPILPSIKEGKVYLAQIGWERSQDVLNVEATAQSQRLVQGQTTPAQMAAALDKKLAEAN